MKGSDIIRHYKPVIRDDIAGYDLILELNDEQYKVLGDLFVESIRKKSKVTDPVTLNKLVAQAAKFEDKSNIQEFYKDTAILEYVLSGKVPFKRTKNYVPWLTSDAIVFLEYHLIPYHVKSILEIGGGNSSIWYAKRVGSVVTVETNPLWREAIQRWMFEEKLTNLIVLKKLEQVPNRHYDLIMIDGDDPDQCLGQAKQAAQSGCKIIGIDNIKFTNIKGERVDGSGEEAHKWLSQEWKIYKILSDTGFYVRK